MAKKTEAPRAATTIFDWIYLFTWAFMPFVFNMYNEKVQDAGLYPPFAFIALMTIVLAVLSFTKKMKDTLMSWPMLAVFFFLVWHLAGRGQANAASEFWATLARNITVFAYLIITWQLLRNDLLRFKYIMYGGLAFAAISAIGILPDLLRVLIKGNFVQDVYQVKGLFIHKNFATSALMMALPLVFLATREKNSTVRLIAFASLAIIIFEIAMLRTRGVWLGLMGGVAITVGLHLLSKNRDSLPLKPIFIGIGAFVSLLVAVFLFTGSKEKILDTSNVSIRMVYWNNSVEMAKEHPLTGVGAGNWKTNFPKYGLEGTNSSVIMGETSIAQPHNDMLWVLAEMGIPGWLAFAAFQLLMLFAGVKLLAKETGESRHQVMASIFGLIAFAIYGLGEFPIERPHTFALLMLPLANLLFLAEKHGVLQRKIIMVPAIVPLATVAVFSVVGLWVFNARITGEKHAKKAVEAYSQRNGRLMQQKATDAKSDLFELDIFINPMEFFIGLGLMEQSRFTEAEQVLKEGLEIYPYHLNTMVQLGDCYKFQKKNNQAILVYDDILKISPAFYRANLNKAEIYMRENKVYEALACLNLVSYRTNYQKYQDVGLAVLKAFINEENPEKLGELHQLLKPYANDAGQAWQTYNNWKRDKVLKRTAGNSIQ